MILPVSTVILFAVGAHAWGKDGYCTAQLSDGPADADVEITLGNLPASTSSEQVVLYFKAARKSTIEYDPLTNPGAAQVYGGACKAYAKPGESDFNGGKVIVGEDGTATIRVQAPATYSSWHQGTPRFPHVHFGFCDGSRSHSQKIVLGADGVYLSRSGCGRSGRSHGNSPYKILAVNTLDMGATTVLEADPEEKDWDALEFSPVYQCLLDNATVYDHFASECGQKCPSHADMRHRQCVRPSGAEATAVEFAASWRLRLECDEKCWAEVVDTTMHGIRLAVADHLDVPFQEATDVQLWKDAGAPTTHAHLRVKVTTDRLIMDTGSSVLKGFVTNASFASDLLGMEVHEVQMPDDSSEMGNSANVVSKEKPDQFDQYYTKLEQGSPRTIAGVRIPDEVPVAALVGAAAAVIVFGSMLVFYLHVRRRQKLRQAAAATATAKIEEGKLPECDASVKVEPSP